MNPPRLTGFRYIPPFRWPGQTFALLHRISGLAIVLYLFLHIYNIAAYAIAGPEAFNHHMLVFETPLFKAMEALLIAAVAFHGINGVRVILIDFGVIGKRSHAAAGGLSFLLSLGVFVLAGWYFIFGR